MPAGPIGSVWASGSWSDTAWEAGTWATLVVASAFDMNTRIYKYLLNLYSLSSGDNTTLILRYLNDRTETEWTARMQALIAAASA